MKNLSVVKVSLTRERRFSDCPSLKQFTCWVNAVFEELEVEKKYEINIHLANHESARKINFDYRNKNYATNILSFNYDLLHQKHIEAGELIFCPEVIMKEAENEHKDLTSHWMHLTIHGTLHILGLDHANNNQAEIMESYEKIIITNLVKFSS